jgi:hypothetical protein
MAGRPRPFRPRRSRRDRPRPHAHAGWDGERTRGASALEDWADVVITMTRDKDDETQRFLRAIGRDVDLEEDRLDFHAPTRTVTLAGVGSRRQIAADRKIAELSVFVARAAREHPGASISAVERAIKEMDDAPSFRNGEVSRAAKYAQKQGLMRIEKAGRGRPSALYVLEHPTSATSPQPLPGTGSGPLPPLPIGERSGRDGSEGLSGPEWET